VIFFPNSKPIDFVFDLGGLVSSERTTSPTGLFIYQPLRPTVYRQATVCVDENKNKVGLLQLATLIRFQSIGVANGVQWVNLQPEQTSCPTAKKLGLMELFTLKQNQ